MTGGAERHGEREHVVGVQVRGDGDRRNGRVDKLGCVLEVTLAGRADGLPVGVRDHEKPSRT